MADPDRLPEHARAFELFTEEHFDIETARILARSELEHRVRLDADERQPIGNFSDPDCKLPKPLGRLVGFDRGEATESRGTP